MNYVDHQDRGEALFGMKPGFTKDQLRKLVREVDASHTHTRDFDGRKLTYIEGWYAIAQANQVFGYAGWDREMVHFERIIEKQRGDTITCGYLARVRIRVRAGSVQIVREGTGWGSASAIAAAAANERALKSAETDATKRALSTFGPRFGLSLYDKDRVTANQRPTFTLFTPDGRPLADNLSAEAYSSGLRQLIDVCRDAREVDELTRHNRSSISDLRVYVPSLRNAQGTHFADLLLRLLRRRQERFSVAAAGVTPELKADIPPPSLEPEPQVEETTSVAIEKTEELSPDKMETDCAHATVPMSSPDKLPPVALVQDSAQAQSLSTLSAAAPDNALSVPHGQPLSGARIDKSQLRLSLERRIRDKDHLRRVAELPCLICSRQPSHAHHLRFAQRRGLSQKVSDEFVVPLCALHHGDLHRSASEQTWWERQKLDPLAVSAELWIKFHQ